MRRSSAAAMNAPVKRCAIYTRKSTTMGLEQEFNSLDAQREACQAYVRSQSGSGWVELEDRYDDGGFTGANLDRPGFARLQADVDAGKIDIIVVYKIDRISRSLLDFTSVMDWLQRTGVAFVSVTQSFSTTDATGRLTLNLLATFAEFEREQISERTRDKVAGARRRGRWTGGPVPLGYRVVEKKLVVDDLEAVLVREIYSLYLDQRSVLAVVRILNESGRTTKRHLAGSGRMREARRWGKNDVLRVLRNPLYAGFMTYGDELHEGLHEAIIDRTRFDEVKLLLANPSKRNAKHPRNPEYLLGGILFCSCGSALTPVSARKGKREYRYYRCVRRDKEGTKACPTRPLSAPVVEEFVASQLRAAISESDLATDLAASVAARIDSRRRDLLIERRQLPDQIAALSAEGHRLVEKVEGAGCGAQRILDKRLEDVGAQLQRLERRLTDVVRELAVLEATEIEAGWITQCLREFEAVWDVLTNENKGRLLRAVVQRVDFDGKSGEIKVSIAALDLADEEDVA